MVNDKIEPYDYQKATNVKEHNEIINKLNEVIDAVNKGGVEVDVYTKAEINARLFDVIARVEAYTDETAQGKLTAGPGITIENNIISAVGVDPESGMLPFTNFSAGSIVGDVSEDGRIYAVETGHGKVLGWDELKERINDDELAIGAKQNKLKAGRNITIDDDDTINADLSIDAYSKEETDALLNKKQNKLTAGRNITIEGDVINADTTIDAYTKAETDNLLAQKQIKLIPGTGISLDSQGHISATGQIDAYTKAETDSLLSQKQATLRSGSNIKTINNASILGAGNIEISGGTVDDALSPTSRNAVQNRRVYSALQEKQDNLISGSNIKTINSQSLLGSGNINVGGDSYKLEQATAIGLKNRVYLRKNDTVQDTIKTYVPECALVVISSESDYTYTFKQSYSVTPFVFISHVRNSDSEPNHPMYIRTVSRTQAVISSRGSTYSGCYIMVVDPNAFADYANIDVGELYPVGINPLEEFPQEVIQ